MNDADTKNDQDHAEPASTSVENTEDIAFEEVIPEDAPPRKNLPEEPTIRKPSGKHVPVE